MVSFGVVAAVDLLAPARFGNVGRIHIHQLLTFECKAFEEGHRVDLMELAGSGELRLPKLDDLGVEI